MPFRSEAQRRMFYVLRDRGEISDKTLAEWTRATKKQKKKLPERVEKSDVLEVQLVPLSKSGIEQAGSAPRKNTPPMPAYSDIYYAPDDPERTRREEEALANRRRAMSRQTSGKFGFHGAAQPTAELRYNTEEQFLQPRDALKPVQRPKVQTPALDRMQRKPFNTAPDVVDDDPEEDKAGHSRKKPKKAGRKLVKAGFVVPGGMRAGHKYLRRVPKAGGGFEYIYAEPKGRQQAGEQTKPLSYRAQRAGQGEQRTARAALAGKPAGAKGKHPLPKAPPTKGMTQRQSSQREWTTPVKPSPAAARVGVPGMMVIPPPSVPKLPNLTPEERQMESKFAQAFEANPEQAASDFYGVAAKGSFVFETDGAKALLHDWKRDDLPPDEKGKPIHPERAKVRALYNTALHQTANAIAKRAFLKRLDEIEKMPPEKRKILVTSGGCAAGKGVGLAARPDLPSSVAATWDAAGEQNATENAWLIEECRKRGIKPTFMFVHSDPERAWKGAVKRAEGAGRMIDARVFADSYAEGAKNFAQFHAKHQHEADFVFAELKWQPDGSPAVQLGDQMPESARSLNAEQIYQSALKYIDAEHEAGRVATHIYKGATAGRRIWGASA